MEATPKIFISYSSKDRSAAEAIHASLETAEFTVWRDQTRLETDWSEEIARELSHSDLVCLLWSENSATSQWVQHEWLTAQALNKLIIPCCLPNAPKLPLPLFNLQGLSFSPLPDGCRALNQRIKRINKDKNFFKEYDYTISRNIFIPYRPNPHFTGRRNDLLELYLKMIGNLNKIGISQVGIVGLGGIGKTQLAVEFAYRFSYAFQAIYWIQAANPDTWLTQFLSLAKNLLRNEIKDFDELKNDKQVLFALQEYFQAHPNILVIMDNVLEPIFLNNDTYFSGFTPLTLGCDLLFTTRRHFQLPGVDSQPVNTLSAEGAYALLASYRTPSTPEDEGSARDICSAVGFLPLAVTLAGAYLRYFPEFAFTDYRDELGKKKLAVIDIGKMSEAELATRHEAAVKATLEDNWRMLQDEDAQQLFRLAGQFPEAAIIPKARLGLLAGISPGQSKIDQPLSRAFKHLHDLCLVERLEAASHSARLHPLVREFANQLLGKEDSVVLRTAAATSLKDALFDYPRLETELRNRGIEEIIADLETGCDWFGPKAEGLEGLKLLLSALRLSAPVLASNPSALASQLFGRLLDEKKPEINLLLDQAKKAKKSLWLRPLRASLVKPGGPLLRTLRRGNHVTALILMPEEKKAVSGEIDGTLTIWDLEKAMPIREWREHAGNVRALGVSPDGCFLVAVFSDGWLKVRSLQDGGEILGAKFHCGNLAHAAISKDGRFVAFVPTGKKNLLMLELGERYDTYQEIFQLSEPEIHALALTPNGKKLFWVVRGTLKILKLKAGVSDSRVILDEVDFDDDSLGADTLAVSPDGNRVVYSSIDSPFWVWDLSRPDKGHKSMPAGRGNLILAIAPDGKRGISTDKGGSLILWDLERFSKIVSLSGFHTNLVYSVLFTSDGLRALSAGGDNTVKIWDLKNISGPFEAADYHPAHAITALAFSPDRQLVASGSWSGSVALWDVSRAEQLSPPLSIRYGPVRKIIFLPDANRLVVFSESGKTYCDLKTMTCDELIYSSNGPPCAVTSDRRRAVSFTFDGLVIFDLVEEKILHTEKTDIQPRGPWLPAAMTFDGKMLFISDDNKLCIYDTKQKKFLPPSNVEAGPVSSLALSADEKQAILGCDDGTIQLYNLENHHWDSLIKQHSREVNSLAIVPDGSLMVSCSADASLILWDLMKKEPIAEFSGDSRLYSCLITPDGGTIIAGDNSGRMHFLKFEREM